MNRPTRLGESLLLQGYGLGMRVERCACGGFVGALMGDEQAAVYAHNASELHEMWRLWADALDEVSIGEVPVIPTTLPLPDPTAQAITVDVSGHLGASGPAGAAA